MNNVLISEFATVYEVFKKIQVGLIWATRFNICPQWTVYCDSHADVEQKRENSFVLLTSFLQKHKTWKRLQCTMLTFALGCYDDILGNASVCLSLYDRKKLDTVHSANILWRENEVPLLKFKQKLLSLEASWQHPWLACQQHDKNTAGDTSSQANMVVSSQRKWADFHSCVCVYVCVHCGANEYDRTCYRSILTCSTSRLSCLQGRWGAILF